MTNWQDVGNLFGRNKKWVWASFDVQHDWLNFVSFFPQECQSAGAAACTSFDYWNLRCLFQATVHVNTLAFDQGRSDFGSAVRKMAAHEVGHTYGLADQHYIPTNPNCGGQTKGATIMNAQCGVNDFTNNMPLGPTGCDGTTLGYLQNVWISKGSVCNSGGGGGPGGGCEPNCTDTCNGAEAQQCIDTGGIWSGFPQCNCREDIDEQIAPNSTVR
jgi:hypothetical protein